MMKSNPQDLHSIDRLNQQKRLQRYSLWQGPIILIKDRFQSTFGLYSVHPSTQTVSSPSFNEKTQLNNILLWKIKIKIIQTLQLFIDSINTFLKLRIHRDSETLKLLSLILASCDSKKSIRRSPNGNRKLQALTTPHPTHTQNSLFLLPPGRECQNHQV